jgi:hypothetical protein
MRDDKHISMMVWIDTVGVAARVFARHAIQCSLSTWMTYDVSEDWQWVISNR